MTGCPFDTLTRLTMSAYGPAPGSFINSGRSLAADSIKPRSSMKLLSRRARMWERATSSWWRGGASLTRLPCTFPDRRPTVNDG